MVPDIERQWIEAELRSRPLWPRRVLALTAAALVLIVELLRCC